ncbi:MAG: nicotinate phosphoribosyltransferase [Dehalococcoidia bacterium]|nr:nicotinate phosphoribosyltransferase [Dehalococcoidia bacterium]
MAHFEPSEDIISGRTADIYFQRTLHVLEREGLNPTATMEFFPARAGIFCGIEEAKVLLSKVLSNGCAEVWALTEGELMERKEVVLRIIAPYRSYGLYETALCGLLAHQSGWATAARECAEAANDIPVVSFGARHIHPLVAAVMDYAAVVGGCRGCSTVKGAELAGLAPSGTMPHALVLTMGDTVRATEAFDKHTPPEVTRVSLVDTFRDEAEEALRVAHALGERLAMVRLDTPRERGGVTPELVREVRCRLDLAGFKHVGIFVSGGFTAERIRQFVAEKLPVDGFGVGSFISGAPPIDFTADIRALDGQAIAKRGRLPGITPNPRLRRLI